MKFKFHLSERAERGRTVIHLILYIQLLVAFVIYMLMKQSRSLMKYLMSTKLDFVIVKKT